MRLQITRRSKVGDTATPPQYQLQVSPTKQNPSTIGPEEEHEQASDFVKEFAQAMQSDLQAMSRNNGMSTMQI